MSTKDLGGGSGGVRMYKDGSGSNAEGVHLRGSGTRLGTVEDYILRDQLSSCIH